MSQTTTEVDSWIANASSWQNEIRALRAILLDCDLTEELKSRKPCYTFDGNNVAIIQPFKGHCSLMFFKGALIEDAHGVLVAPGANSQAARRIDFTDEGQVRTLKKAIRQYVDEAIDIERSGKTVDFKAKENLTLPEELVTMLDDDPDLAEAFHALTPGRQRGWVLHLSDAKQSKTRVSRIERGRERILAGKGFNER